MTPSLASRDSTRITRRDRLDVNADQSRFAMQFRYRMSLLYQSAEGAESSIDTKTVVYMIAVYLFFPFASLIATARVIRERTALGFDRDAAIRMFRRFFSLQFLVYLLGCLVWVSAVVNPILYVSTHAGCATLFEALYPGTMVGFGVLAGSIFRGYTARDIRPGKFKLHRMQVRSRTRTGCCDCSTPL